MIRSRSLRAACWVFSVLLVFGCSCSRPLSNSVGGSLDAKGDSAGKAVAAAQKSMKQVAPDAVAVMVGSGGVSLNPPPEQWSVMFISPSSDKTYSVAVSHAEAEAPRELGSSKIPDSELKDAIPYDSLKIGSDRAYAKGKETLAKSGEVPPQLMMNIALVKLDALPQYKPAVWNLTFMKGTSLEGSRKVDVDAKTGDATEVK